MTEPHSKNIPDLCPDESSELHLHRRQFLGALLGAATAPVWAGTVQPFTASRQASVGQASAGYPGATNAHTGGDFWAQPRVLRLKRYQNNEKIEIAYWRNGGIDVDAYRHVCWLMRDLHAGVAAAIDPRVLDLICAMQAWVGFYGFKKPFLISSGYRTLTTNNNLEGAAKNSMHLHGKAVDVIFPDLPVGYVGRLAQHYSAGGVGFYPSRGFVHIDTGRIRTWGKR